MPETDDERLIRLISAGVQASMYARLALRFPASAGGFNKMAGLQRARVEAICGQIVEAGKHGAKPPPRSE